MSESISTSTSISIPIPISMSSLKEPQAPLQGPLDIEVLGASG